MANHHNFTLLLSLCCAFIFVTPGLADYAEYKQLMIDLALREDMDGPWEEHVKLFAGAVEPRQSSSSFECEVAPSLEVPTSVHRLQPADIKVVAALGDSLTAGNGADAKTIIGVLRQFRGFSWSVGGYKDYDTGITTMPNILRKYNADLLGYSTATGTVDSAGAGLNVAEPGNKAKDMPRQARNLVTKMKARTDINMEEDWKVVTLFIGGNDLCDYCKDKDEYSTANYITHIQEALDILHAELPRTFVNLVSILDITPVAKQGDNFFCREVHASICNCGIHAENAEMLLNTSKAYARSTEDLALSGRYDDRDDFTVVFQPFWQNSRRPTTANGQPDLSYFAPDCFHFSAKGHAVAAGMLWNGMFEPVGHKSRAMPYDVKLQCPMQGAFLATKKNSAGQNANDKE